MSFPTTHWTLIARATMNGDGPGREALARLCADYRPAVAGFLRSQGMSAPEVDDLVQDFFLALLESRLWKRADRQRGKFRSFLIGVVQHVRLAGHARRMTQKRGAGAVAQSLEELAESGVEPVAPDLHVTRAFDRAWALQLMANALSDTEDYYRGKGTSHIFAELSGHLTGKSAPPCAESAARLGIPEATCKSHTFRLRQRFRDFLHARVSATVGSAEDIEGEMRHLQEILLTGGLDAPDSRDG